MNKKHFLIVFTMFIIALLVSGASCPIKRGNVDPEKEAEQTMKYGTDIYKGNDGIVVQFVQDVPPKRVYSNEPLTVAFDLYNRGASDADMVFLYLSGIDPNIANFGFDSANYDHQLDPIPGKATVLGDGGFTTVTLDTGENPLFLPPGIDVYSPKIIGTVCYAYETTASPVICLDPNPFGSFTGDRACKISDIPMSGGQGAPVAITRVEQMPMRGATQLKIHIKNVGKGKVIRSDKLRSCTRVETQDYNLINKLDGYFVAVGVDRFYKWEDEYRPLPFDSFTPTISCSPPTVRMVNNEAILLCTYKFPATQINAYTSPITIKLFYSYIESTTPYSIDIMNIEPVT